MGITYQHNCNSPGSDPMSPGMALAPPNITKDSQSKSPTTEDRALNSEDRSALEYTDMYIMHLYPPR
jgi:hypothetical protein